MIEYRRKWKAPLRIKGKTEWQCTQCGTGDLVVLDGTFKESETLESKRIFDGQSPNDKNSVFVSILRCSNEKCYEVYSTLGDYQYRSRLMQYEHFNPETVDVEVRWDDEISELAKPVYIHPPPHIIHISPRCPTEIREVIQSAFCLFWCDLPACANRLRSCVEQFLTQQNVPKEKISKKGDNIRLYLKERITLYQKSNPVLGDVLQAIRFLGNEGSHYEVLSKDKELTTDDALDAFMLLEYVLEETYVGKTKEINKIVSEIMKAEGPRSREKKSKE